jgi:plastocyanin
METNRERNLRLFMAAALALLLAPPLLSDTVTLPAVTSLPVGAAASPFFSDVRVFNTSYTSPVSVTAVYRCFVGTCPGAAPQVTFTLSPRQSMPFDNMVSSAFNAPSTAGAVEFSSSGSSVRVTSRLYSPVPSGGTNGMFVPGMNASDAHAASVLTELSNGLFRTNIGVYNGNDAGVSATIKLYNGSTLLGTQTLNLGPRSGMQVNRIFDAVGQAGMTTTNAFAVVTADNPSLGLFAYAAVIDNATADSSFVSGAEDDPAPAVVSPQTINVNLVNYMFTPGTSQPIQVTAGASTTLVFEATQGSHGFSGVSAIGLAGTNKIEAASDGDPYYGNGAHPAVTYTVTFTPPESARGQTFNFFCTVHGAMVMPGTLHVN